MTKRFYFFLLSLVTFSVDAEILKLKQVLQNGSQGIQGISNPRDITISPSLNKIFLVSGDDDALTMLDIDEHFNLSHSQSFTDKQFPKLRLKGASSVRFSKAHQRVYTTSFYSGALTSFSYQNDALLAPTSTLSDNLDHKVVFNDFNSVKSLDSHGLLGAWSAVISPDNKTILTSSYMSNAVSVFKLDEHGNASFKEKLLPNQNWGYPTSIAQTSKGNMVFVAGFESNQIFVLRKVNGDAYALNQTLSHPTLQNPQNIFVSHSGKYIFVAAAKSNSLITFKQDEYGQYAHHQSIQNHQLPTQGLNGACCIAMSPKGRFLFASAEADAGILIFNHSKKTGKLSLLSHIQSLDGVEINNVSVLKTTADGKHLLVGTGKQNQLLVLQVVH
ncbi:beta-propeller fold lactonase family protein [Pseudoalteromonas sp. SMS1]|uniref:lactonase family protein n=1 Tax=Pseudoalteromonas sp. SMS1 TaxID=2908894 RepID=UPI001F406521|nr:beta-propeller fold lactonase family protein [Pseudoalteromonas sp. SMS1]MCF2859524.1 beta-propeller fold lactonase family protein [Pseudoalteromonas sp. SMS1]